MTLVIATMISYMLITTGILASADTKVEGKVPSALSNASSIAEEALSSVMNVAALGAKDKILQRFKKPIAVATQWDIRRGPLQASIYGNMFFAVQSVYALTLFYGVKLVSYGEIGSGGSVMTFVLHVFAILMLIFLRCSALDDYCKVVFGNDRPYHPNLGQGSRFGATDFEAPCANGEDG